MREKDRVWPKSLHPGAVVAVVAPSGPVKHDRLRQGVAVLESWGLEVRISEPALGRHAELSYLAGDDAVRAEDFTRSWTDAEVDAVWAARGGYGAQRMVDLIDYQALRRVGPKQLIGFSDITSLHARIGRELDQITVHGATAAGVEQLNHAPTVNDLRTLLFDGPTSGRELCRGTKINSGVATGRLIGGNLSLLASDVGVEPLPSVPSIVVLEDVEEDAYKVDRMATQLRRSGWFGQVTGVVLGDFTHPDPPELMRATIADRLGELGLPLIDTDQFGHVDLNRPLPLGADVRLDAEQGILSLI